MANKYIIGFLLLVVLSSSVYILMPDTVKLKVDKYQSKFYVWDNDTWDLAGREFVYLYKGSTKKNAMCGRDVDYSISDNITTIVRTVDYCDDTVVKNTYVFDGSNSNVELFPISHHIECTNCEGFILHYEVRDIEYEGETKIIESPFSFGKNMQVEWDYGDYYSKVFQQKSSDKLIIRYRPDEEVYTKEIRLFDPYTTTVIDNFDDSSIDAALWDTYLDGDGTTISEGSQYLEMVSTDGDGGYLHYIANNMSVGDVYVFNTTLNFGNPCWLYSRVCNTPTKTDCVYGAWFSICKAQANKVGNITITMVDSNTMRFNYELCGQSEDVDISGNSGYMPGLSIHGSTLYNIKFWNVWNISESSPADTCTYSSGDWDIDCSDTCVLSDATNLGTNDFNAYGSGTVNVNAVMSNIDNVIIEDGCEVVVSSNGELGVV